jgi:hypothetical protein
MTTAEFVESIPEFSRLSYAEQVKRFCWLVAAQGQNVKITGAAIGACFDDVGCPKPSSVAPFLASLTRQKPPFLIKRKGFFELTRHAREQLDPALGKRSATIAVDKLLRDLPSKLSIEAEKVYLEEALTCFRHGAFRGAVVMAWNLAYDHLCKVIMNNPRHLADFSAQLPKSYPRAEISAIGGRDDFEALKESQVLQVAKSANIISASVHNILKQKLDRRNIAAHPSNITISTLTAEEFIIDLVQNVVLKFRETVPAIADQALDTPQI